MKLFLSALIMCNMCFAQPVTPVKKGEQVPFDGILFTKEKEKEVRTALEVSEKRVITLSKLNDLNNAEISILTDRLELYQKKSKELSDRESRLQDSSFLKNSLYFIAGALITGVIGYGVVRAYR
jgi:hypothetical protein